MTFTFPANQVAAAAMPIACRKRKEMDEGELEEPLERGAGIKGVRRWADVPLGSQEAEFYPLPKELNLQMLANLGYNVANQQSSATAQEPRARFSTNHSPSSSGSDLCPSTPNDVASSAESYFVKGINSEAGSSPSYPTFDIYPDNAFARPPGLMGMHMHRKSFQSLDTDDGMDVDSDEQHDGEAGPSHGSHCKSIPQLHCRGTGATKELWAHCLDCGTLSQVDCPPRLPDALAYSP